MSTEIAAIGEVERDALWGLANLAMARAATSIRGDRFCYPSHLATSTAGIGNREAGQVWQSFQRGFHSRALLILNKAARN